MDCNSEVEQPEWVERSLDVQEQGLLMQRGDDVLRLLARHPDLLPEHQETLARLPLVRPADPPGVYRNEEVGFAIVDGELPPDPVMQYLARNENLTLAAQRIIVETGDDQVLAVLARNENLHSSLFEPLLERCETVLEDLVTQGKNLPDSLWERLLGLAVSDVDLRSVLPTAPRATDEELMVWARDVDEDVRSAVARRVPLASEIQDVLCLDEHSWVLDALTWHPEKLTQQVVERLLGRPNSATTVRPKISLIRSGLLTSAQEQQALADASPGMLGALASTSQNPGVTYQVLERVLGTKQEAKILSQLAGNPYCSSEVDEYVLELGDFSAQARFVFHKRLTLEQQRSYLETDAVHSLALNRFLDLEVVEEIARRGDPALLRGVQYHPSFTWEPWVSAKAIWEVDRSALKVLLKDLGADVEVGVSLAETWNGSVAEIAEAARLTR